MPLPAWPVAIAPFIVLVWLVIGVVVVFTVYRGSRANDLRLAGVAMGEAVEHAIEERCWRTTSCHRPEANVEVSRSGGRPRQQAARRPGGDSSWQRFDGQASSSPAPRRASASGS